MAEVTLQDHGQAEGQYSRTFLQGMLNRTAMAYHRYGPTGGNTEVDWLASARLRLGTYSLSGNAEMLMDAAVFLMCEAMYPRHPDAHFEALQPRESPGLVALDGSLRKTTKQKPPKFHLHEGD